MFIKRIFALLFTLAISQDLNSQTKMEILYPESLKNVIDTSKLNIKIYNQGAVPYGKTVKGFLQLDFDKDGKTFPLTSYQGQFLIGNDTSRQPREKLFQLKQAKVDLDLLLVVGDDKSLDKMYKGNVYFDTPILQLSATEGQQLYQKIEEMSQGGKVPRVQIEVTFPKLVFDLLQKEAKVVYFDFWVPANDHFAFQNIYQIFNKLETFEVEKNMQINYLFYEDPVAKKNNFNETLNYCVSNGRYCLYVEDMETDITACYIEESLRQYYIQKYYKLSFNEYLKAYYENCISQSAENIDDCSRQEQTTVGIDAKKIDKLVKFSYVENENSSSDNFILGAAMSEAQTEGFVLTRDDTPIFLYNGQEIRGNWQNDRIFSLMCDTLTEKPPQCTGEPKHKEGHSYTVLVIFIILGLLSLSYYFYRRNQQNKQADYYNLQGSKNYTQA